MSKFEDINDMKEPLGKTTIKIMDNIVIGNAFFSTERSVMTKEEIHNYWYIVDELLPKLYYTYGSNNSFFEFYEDYSFLFKRINNSLELTGEKYMLERYFRLGVPKQVIKVFDEAGIKFNNDLNEQKVPIKRLVKKDNKEN